MTALEAGTILKFPWSLDASVRWLWMPDCLLLVLPSNPSGDKQCKSWKWKRLVAQSDVSLEGGRGVKSLVALAFK